MNPRIGLPPDFNKRGKKELWRFRRDPIRYITDTTKGKRMLEEECIMLSDAVIVPRSIPNPHELENVVDTLLPVGALNFPFLSYNIVPLEDGIFEDIISSPSIIRLIGIKQLSYLTGFEYNTETGEEVFNAGYLETGYSSFVHTREQHSVMVSLLMSYLLRDFSRYDYVNGVLAGAFHDIATPAGGEATAQISNEFDEEENFTEIFHILEDEEDWERRYPEFNLSYIASIIKNKGLAGKILDICDKIAYVTLDCYHFAYAGHNQMRDFALGHPLFGDVLLDVRISPDKQSVYFQNKITLFYFLYARALEFEDLLKRPGRKVNEYYVRSLVKQLLDEGIVSKRDLLTQTDGQLLQTIKDHFGEDITTLWKRENFLQAIICSPEEIDTTIKEYRSKGWVFLGKEKLQSFSPGTSLLVSSNGHVISFREAEPELAKYLDSMASTTNEYGLYFRAHRPQNI